MRLRGITVNELIEKLEELKKEGHGEAEVVVGGTDYPEGATKAYVERYGNSYTPKGAVKIT